MLKGLNKSLKLNLNWNSDFMQAEHILWIVDDDYE